VRAALLKNKLVAAVFSSEDVAAACPPDEDASTAALVCRSFPSAAADLFVVPAVGSFWDPLYVLGKGSSHGSPHLFDRAVPMLGRAPKRIDAARVIEPHLGFQVFAQTACDLLDVPFSVRGSRETLVTR
jgi:hypothetical protein